MIFKTTFRRAVSLFSALVIVVMVCVQWGMAVPRNPNMKTDISLKKEVRHAVDKGLQWLKGKQDPGGFWSQPDYPALSGLVLTAYMGEPSGRFKEQPPKFIQEGYKYLLKNVKPDGGIYGKDLANYNTAISMMALKVSNNPSYTPILRKARNFLVGLQGDFNEKGKLDSPYDGGIGYGARYKHSDMSNTLLALETLYYTKDLVKEVNGGDAEMKKLNWPAVITFIRRCQNLPGHNDQPWVNGDPINKGGFIYFPGDSKAGEMTLPSGKTALRSYGSISYAGLLSYIYADLKRDDAGVKAVFEWLKRNFSLDENPGMGAQGLFYYYHTMGKALNLYGVDELTLENGKKVNWRKELVLKLLNLQDGAGFWVNENGRWWEKDPVLVTSYAVITLEILYGGL